MHKRDKSGKLYNWKEIANEFPSKTPLELQLRYKTLLYDIARIERGEQVVIVYRDAEDDGKDTYIPNNSSKKTNRVTSHTPDFNHTNRNQTGNHSNENPSRSNAKAKKVGTSSPTSPGDKKRARTI